MKAIQDVARAQALRGGVAVIATLLIGAAGASAGNWPQFRGPGSLGLSPETGLPVTWSASSNVRWKTPLPGPGHSSPIVWGDRIFLTAFRSESGGMLRRFFGQQQGQLLVVAVDKASGRIVWEREVPADRIESVHSTNSPASPTPVTDGERVYVHFGSFGLIAFDFGGNVVWRRPLGPFPNEWGSASSPILYGDVLLLNSDTDADDFLLAVDKRTGRTIWRTSRSNVSRAWPTPFIWDAGGRDEIVVSGSRQVKGYDPKTGRELWTIEGLPQWVTPTPVSAHGLLYVAANGPGGNVIMAIRPGGRGNITGTHVAWRYDRSAPYNSSPVVAGDYLFTVRNGGIMNCLNARTGELVWQERLPARGAYYASLLAAGERVYAISEDGEVTLVAAGPRFEVIATNQMGERTMASPAVSDGRLFIRTDQHLYAIGR